MHQQLAPSNEFSLSPAAAVVVIAGSPEPGLLATSVISSRQKILKRIMLPVGRPTRKKNRTLSTSANRSCSHSPSPWLARTHPRTPLHLARLLALRDPPRGGNATPGVRSTLAFAAFIGSLIRQNGCSFYNLITKGPLLEESIISKC